jgi:hypothetical protein
MGAAGRFTLICKKQPQRDRFKFRKIFLTWKYIRYRSFVKKKKHSTIYAYNECKKKIKMLLKNVEEFKRKYIKEYTLRFLFRWTM